MATLAQTVPGAAARVNCRWIVGRGADLGLILGGSLAGYAYLLLYAAAHVPISYLWWFWSVGFDGTHIFGTVSRTFLDREARRRSRMLLCGSTAVFFLAGPLMVLAGAKGWLALLVGIWAYYHVMRQHYGVLMLYKVKNRDLAPLDNRLDRLFLAAMLIFPPLHRFFMHHPEELGLKASLGAAEPYFWSALAIAVAAWAGRQTARFVRGDAVNLPKHLLFATVLPLHCLTFAYMSWQAAVPTVTIVHNLQYHALVWFHNRNRYGEDEAAARNGRIASAFARNLALYAAVALVFSAAYRIPGFALGRVSDLAFGFFCGFGLTHYYLDSRIWRVRHDPSLRQALQLA